MIKIIVAVGNWAPGKGFPIGKGGKMAWHKPADLKWFRKTTENNTVVMGRGTYEAIGCKPLPNRSNYILSGTIGSVPDGFDGVLRSVDDIVELGTNRLGDIYVIGGSEVYKSVLDADIVDMALIDYIDVDVPDADSFFPPLDYKKWYPYGEGVSLDGECHTFVYKHAKLFNAVDERYIDLLRDVIYNGETKETRAGRTRSVFGRQLRFDLGKGFPLLTTKKVYTNGVIHELLWFLKGGTNIKYLVDNNVHIWDDDAYRYYLELIEKNNIVAEGQYAGLLKAKHVEPLSKEEFIRCVKEEKDCWLYLDENSVILSYYPNEYCIHYKYGDLGPVYGEQWRNWYGVDQIKNVIETLRTNPDDRRMVVSAWNVKELDKMALPPCHYSFQFYTTRMNIAERMNWAASHDLNCWDEKSMDENGVPSRKLSCMWNQRSVDCGCGLPFNIASYALLTHMVAQCCGMDVGELVFSGGDVHVYENHVSQLLDQTHRDQHRYALPRLELNPNVKEIGDFRPYDINIVGYNSYPAIKLELNVGL